MRDDFSQKVKDELARRVGFLCSNPQCRQPTIGAKDQSVGHISIGEAAHICAASPGGKRYDPNMTPEERADISNGIWLCRNCAALIDRDEDYYTVEMLHMWKNLAESEANNAIKSHKVVKTQVSNHDIEIIDTIVKYMEDPNTIYMVKEYDFCNDFQRDNLNQLFELISLFEKPSSTIQNNLLQTSVKDLLDKVYELRCTLALKGGPAPFGGGAYIIDNKSDQLYCNQLCDEIWASYEKLIQIKIDLEI